VAVAKPARGGALSAPVIATAADGHPTHPVWYHDSVAAVSNGVGYVAWNTNHAAVEARAWDPTSGALLGSVVQVSAAVLDCGCTDSTGTNPNRHDVPTLFADSADRIYAMYGGGTAAKTGNRTGPYFRAATAPGSIDSWGAEQRLTVPGAAYDLEAVTDNVGVTYLIGQQGDNSSGAGSLVYFRFAPGTAASPGSFLGTYRILVKGGKQPVCTWQSSSTCNVFVIGRLGLGPPDPSHPETPAPLYLAWGWSEKNLSNTCGDPTGFCNRGLYVARSLDGGATWSPIGGGPGKKTIQYNDPSYELVSQSLDVGLFKAITVTGSYPGTPWVAYQPSADTGLGTVVVMYWSGTTWLKQTLDASRPWNNHLVMHATSDGLVTLWSDIAQSGNSSTLLKQWSAPASSPSWTASAISVGPNWFLTGVPTAVGEVLVWSAPNSADPTSTLVQLTVVSGR
jgi:hypothetical protein